MELALIAPEENTESDLDNMNARLAEAQKIMSQMDFENMMDKTIGAQMDAMAKMTRQQMSAAGDGADEALIAF